MDIRRPATADVLATYSVPFVTLYSSIILAVIAVCVAVTFTGEPIGQYLARKINMVPYFAVILVGSVVEVVRITIMIYNILSNGGRALFVHGNKLVFFSKYFTSIPIEQIVRVIPRKKKAVYVILSSGKTKKIYTSFLKPSDPEILAKKIEYLIQVK